ncbi:ATP-binding cassette domain-containing protein [Corynebacterium sp. H128]|uniref:ABC transporter ATP-binding protein n=1 Tax=unclassified Corynebacterium TaxID=2624378 RepID=UPI0030A28D04
MLHVACSYGHKLPIGSLDKEFCPGRMYGLRGPNGVGKSTLLQTMANELEPIEGTVSYQGDGIVLRVGDPVFYPDMTVAEHLELLGESSEALVASWDLEPLLELPPAWLSSGQRQRVFLAAQLRVPAGVILIDEPERHLDPDWIAFLCDELKTLADTRIVVVASHSALVQAACDEIVDLR